MAELGIAIEQRDRIKRDQLPIALAHHHRVDFEILRIFIIKTGEHFSREIGDFLGQCPGETSILRQMFQGIGRRSLPDLQAKSSSPDPN